MRLVHVAIVLIGMAFADAALGAAAAGAPFWHRSVQLDYQVAADGTAVATESWEVRADTNAVAHTIAQQSYSYMADLERVELVTAYTRKQDGQIIPVSPDSVLDKAVTTTATAPQFTAQVARTIIFPQVSAGDIVHYELRRITREPMFPGEFLLGVELGSSAVTERADISILMPPGRQLTTASSGLDEQAPQSRPDGSVVRRWRLASEASGPVALQGSTFTDYLAVGRAYASRAARPSRPGNAVRALAAQLAPPGTGEREAVRRLYQYVASEIRYVAAFLGDGRVVPRDAETVLAEGWGDCKDHAALLQALLAADGIDAEPALITLRNRYDLPDPPGLSALDHVITYVPSLDLYLDSTSPYAPFGLLLAGEYDKPVVIADRRHTHLARTPAMPASGVSLTTRTEMRIGPDGVVSGDTTTIAAGPQSIALRSMAGWMEARGSASAASAHLQQLGTPGEGQYDFLSPDGSRDEYQVAGHFTLDQPLPDGGGVPFAIPTGLSIFDRPGKLLLNPGQTEDGGHACFPGHEVEEIRLALPPGTRLRQLPADTDQQVAGARYTSHYAVEGGILTVQREFSLQTDHERCGPEEFDNMRPALALARRDEHALIALVRDPTEQAATSERPRPKPQQTLPASAHSTTAKSVGGAS